ncbi:MAG: hypothetical protein QG626_693 [Patescibacteria group bacterium]|jgi:hypothetical protein|nr:hypothetical protein [Patescibacteria group bacterium]
MAENDLRPYYVFAFKAMADITGTLMIPGLLAVLLRTTYRDIAYEQLIFFVSLVVVFILSMSAVVNKVQRYGREYKQLTDTKVPGARSGTGS